MRGKRNANHKAKGLYVANVDIERLYLTRKEAADYVTKKFFNLTPATLARYAMGKMIGVGPAYSLIGREAHYFKEDLDSWAMKFRPAMKLPPAPRPKPERPARPVSGVLASARTT